MDIKLTQIAKQEFDRMSGEVHGRVLRSLMDELPRSVEKDPKFKLSELGKDVRVHTIPDSQLLALYDLRDVNGDGRDEIVILTLIKMLPGLKIHGMDSVLASEYASRSARIGAELLHNIEQL